MAQERGEPGKQNSELACLTEHHAALERRDRLLKVSLRDVQMADARSCQEETERIVDRFGDLDALLGRADSTSKVPLIRKTHGQGAPRIHRENKQQAETLVDEIALEDAVGPDEALHRPRIVTPSGV